MVRLYRPRPEILSGKWKFPEAPVECQLLGQIRTRRRDTVAIGGKQTFSTAISFPFGH
jgi:hypothetical protein